MVVGRMGWERVEVEFWTTADTDQFEATGQTTERDTQMNCRQRRSDTGESRTIKQEVAVSATPPNATS